MIYSLARRYPDHLLRPMKTGYRRRTSQAFWARLIIIGVQKYEFPPSWPKFIHFLFSLFHTLILRPKASFGLVRLLPIVCFPCTF